jgi:hypothetical protein
MGNLETKVRRICEERGFKNRGCRFEVISILLGITPEEAKSVESITRTIRGIFPIDAKGIELEKAWHSTQNLEIFKVEAKQQYDRLTGERLY